MVWIMKNRKLLFSLQISKWRFYDFLDPVWSVNCNIHVMTLSMSLEELRDVEIAHLKLYSFCFLNEWLFTCEIELKLFYTLFVVFLETNWDQNLHSKRNNLFRNISHYRLKLWTREERFYWGHKSRKKEVDFPIDFLPIGLLFTPWETAC